MGLKQSVPMMYRFEWRGIAREDSPKVITFNRERWLGSDSPKGITFNSVRMMRRQRFPVGDFV